MVVNDANAVVVGSNRLQEGSVPALEQGMVVGQLALADALIIGNCNNQVGGGPASPSLACVGWAAGGPRSSRVLTWWSLNLPLDGCRWMVGWMDGRV